MLTLSTHCWGTSDGLLMLASLHAAHTEQPGELLSLPQDEHPALTAVPTNAKQDADGGTDSM